MFQLLERKTANRRDRSTLAVSTHLGANSYTYNWGHSSRSLPRENPNSAWQPVCSNFWSERRLTAETAAPWPCPHTSGLTRTCTTGVTQAGLSLVRTRTVLGNQYVPTFGAKDG